MTADLPCIHKATRRWYKKYRGKRYYLGTLAADPTGQKALERWQAIRGYVQRGLSPPAGGGGVTVGKLIDEFLGAKIAAAESGDIAQRTLQNYDHVCRRVREFLGDSRRVADLLPRPDLESLRAHLAHGRKSTTLKLGIQIAKTLFRFGYEQGLLDKPLRYGQSFSAPSGRTLRRELARERAASGLKTFGRDDMRVILSAAGSALRAYTLLGLNCAFGAADIADLPLRAISAGWIDYARGKTGIDRRIPLWQETQDAITAAMAIQPAPIHAEDRGLVFLRPTGTRLVLTRRYRKSDRGGVCDDYVGRIFRRHTTRLGLYRPRVGFYALRHTFRTVADEVLDQPAANYIMGHVDPSQAATYRQRISDERLQVVTEHVRQWLLGGDGGLW